MNISSHNINVLQLQNKAERNVDFFRTLHNMTQRVHTFNESFNSKVPRFEKTF